MFDGMDDIEGADPYVISDLRTGAPGVGAKAGNAPHPSLTGMGAVLIPEPPTPMSSEPAPKKDKSWYEYVAGGVSAVGGAIGAQAQAAQAAQVQKLQQMAQSGQLTQQMYNQQMQMINQRAELVRQQEAARGGFFARYKWPLLLGVVAVGGAVYWFWFRKRR